MPNFSSFKLGKLAARHDERTLKLAKYFTAELPDPPAAVDWTSGITDWGVMLNDNLGDCTIAGCGHAEQVWSAARGGEYTFPDSAILQKYEQWCGYVKGDSSTDQGGVEIDVLNNWRRASFWSHKLFAYADVNPTNIKEVCQAIENFGGVYIGVQLPISVQGATEWTTAPSSDNPSDMLPGSWGGHCVFVCKYRTENGKIIFTCISWGGLIDITEDFWLYNDPSNGPYIDEVHVLLAPEFFSLKTGKTPLGFDLAACEKDLAIVSS